MKFPSLYLKLTIAAFLVMLAYSIIRPLLPIFARNLDPTQTLVGFCVSSFFVARIFFEFPSGVLLYKVGVRKFIILGLFLGFFRRISMRFLLHYLYTYIGNEFWGLGTAIFFMGNISTIINIFDAHILGTALGIYQGVEFIGQFVGPPLGGFLAEQMGFSFPFYLSGGLTAISLLIVSTSGSLKRLNVYSGGETANISLRKTLGGLRNRRLLAISVINFSRMFINYGVVSTVLPLYLYDFLRFNVGFIGVILGVRSLGLCFAIFSSGVMSDKIGRKPVASIGILVSSLCIYSYTMVSSPLALLLIGFFDGWGMGMIQIAIWALLPEQVASEYMGGAIGLF
ncbi:MAG: MFS transporter, partial [Candidatus Bathyarchaeia archaeon]